ncbi:integrase core domain-containing protein [Meiothermus sp. Pnk-1]|uniref:integrase core domain-containing protein n=1 Tax=Meiothermus sp. Pnk-1 TaxID=873128 RepID=UPI0026806767
MRLFVLPPRSPRLNGHVGHALAYLVRMQRTFREEFYTRPLPAQLSALQRELEAYLDHYNRERPHRAGSPRVPGYEARGVGPQGVSDVLTDYNILTFINVLF